MQSETPQGTPMPKFYVISGDFVDSDDYNEIRINDALSMMRHHLRESPGVGDVIRICGGTDTPGFWVKLVERIVLPYNIQGPHHTEEASIDYVFERVECPWDKDEYDMHDHQNYLDPYEDMRPEEEVAEVNETE